MMLPNPLGKKTFMSRNNSEILGEEQIAQSLLEPEYPGLILPVGSIASENISDPGYFLDQEYFFDQEYFLDPGYYPGLENSPDPEYSPRLEYEPDSEYFLASEYSPGSEYSRDLEDSLVSNYFSYLEARPDLAHPDLARPDLVASPDLGNPIFSQEIDFDSLTGMPNNSTLNHSHHGSSNTALRNIGFGIQLFSNTNQARVTSTVRVELHPITKLLVQWNLVDLVLQSNIWGVDNYRPFQGGADDYLFDFPNQTITGEGTYTFSRMVPRSALNEDRTWWINRVDEIQNRFRLVSSQPSFVPDLSARSHIITGLF